MHLGFPAWSLWGAGAPESAGDARDENCLGSQRQTIRGIPECGAEIQLEDMPQPGA